MAPRSPLSILNIENRLLTFSDDGENYVLSLYSTATQKYLALGVGVGQCPPTPEFCVGDTNMLVSWSQREPFLPDAKPNISVLSDAKPKRKPVEYRLRLVPGVGSLRWACTFHIFCVNFICVG